MSDRRNRRILAVIGLLLAVGGALSVCLGAQVFGTHRSNEDIFDPALIRWWDEGGWMSFAVVVAIGLVGVIVGMILVLSQLHRHDGLHNTPTVTFPPTEGTRGETTLRSPALSHNLEVDLERIPDVHGAMVGLYGAYPDIELRAMLDIGDDADLEQLPARVDEVLDRLHTTTGIRPDPVRVTVRFKAADRERQLA